VYYKHYDGIKRKHSTTQIELNKKKKENRSRDMQFDIQLSAIMEEQKHSND
jgi:hypothetical protein